MHDFMDVILRMETGNLFPGGKMRFASADFRSQAVASDFLEERTLAVDAERMAVREAIARQGAIGIQANRCALPGFARLSA
jgi:hypothetical protein